MTDAGGGRGGPGAPTKEAGTGTLCRRRGGLGCGCDGGQANDDDVDEDDRAVVPLSLSCLLLEVVSSASDVKRENK